MNKILVVIDMQNDFVDGVLGSDQAVQIVGKVAEKIGTFSGDIIVTYDTHFSNYLDTAEGKKLPVVHCVKGTNGWELNKYVQKALVNKKYSIVEKPNFGSPVELPNLIKNKYGDYTGEIHLIGVCTDICVVSNANILKANFPQAEIFVDSACCAGVTVEKHKAALETMRSCQINVY